LAEQVRQIQTASSGLYSRQNGTYSAIESWLMAGADTRQPAVPVCHLYIADRDRSV
jgi:hypothetical protein